MSRAKIKEIVCEFIPPARHASKAIIFCGGMPGVPKHRETMAYWAKRGYFCIFPRYRGTWESGGEFLTRSPHEDILEVAKEIRKGVKDLWTGAIYRFPKSLKIYLIGGSFGGTASILASPDKEIEKAVAISPVIDWKAPSKEEPMGKLGRYIKEGFGQCYRFNMKNWKRLSNGEFYNPKTETERILPEKLLIFHAKDDEICPYLPTKKFAKKTGTKLITLARGGHFGSSDSHEPRFAKKISEFLRY